MQSGSWVISVITVFSLACLNGCAISPIQEKPEFKAQISERATLSDAASAVEYAPWPKPEPVSLFGRMAGGDDDRVSRDDAVAYYIGALYSGGAPFPSLIADAEATLAAADKLNATAEIALDAPRLTMNDVADIEGAIQALRAHRRIYMSAADVLRKEGVAIDDIALEQLRAEFKAAVKRLGKSADKLADRIHKDRSETFAAAAGAAN